ncbi:MULTISPECIES: RidA family protein [Sphingosinicellaceae]|uniref:RidA family protein n=1 Tax=Sphingosinicellaceae TaxID=2820280 RepID=UPI001C1DEE9A|nr:MULTISPECIES: Rid family hydrolase [Polymorphobacter]QYE35635.1 RidA family protein [Polymorphobacter sp. PAMC 29334]UAJ10999.1 RidA family protein [Polymorphobacter megasporae]
MEQVVTQPDPYEPFALSQGIRVGNLVYASGQAGYDVEGRIVEGGFMAQGEQAFSNLDRVLRAGGSSLDRVVKVTIFITDMDNFGSVVALRRKFFSQPFPADSLVGVKALYRPEAVFEIEAIGLTDNGAGT